jgi:CRS1 / YhbY (CRM) domain
MELTGQDRRALRSEAGRREARKTLATVRLPVDASRDPGYVTAAKEIGERLRREEIVRVKTAEKKKKNAKAVGEGLAEAIGAELAQVLGHTVLLYKKAEDDGADLKEGLHCILKPVKETAV